jgi:hypothetical protein
MKMVRLILLMSFCLLSLAQTDVTYMKYGDLRWEIGVDHLILKIKPDYNEFQLNTKLAEIGGSVSQKLNTNDYYLVKFNNSTKSELIFERKIEQVRQIPFITDMVPLMKFSDKLSNLDIYENSDISGFSFFKNDSLFTENLKLRANFVSCYNREFRNQPKFVRYIFVNFNIDEGQTKNLTILETDMEEEYLDCIKRVILNENWRNEKFKGRVSFFYIVYVD